MRYIKNYISRLNIFENNYYLNGRMGFFVIEGKNSENDIELIREDLIAILEILTNNSKYNTYISDNIEIYLYDNALTIIQDETKIDIHLSEFRNLLKNIYNYIDKTAEYNEVFNDDYKSNKTYVEDHARLSKKYNL
jgi:hypothetical protein